MIVTQFLRNLIKAIPYTIHTILTDNGIQFTNVKRGKYAMQHIFDRVCEEHNIEHLLTQVKHPWTNGQVERMNQTIKRATVNSSIMIIISNYASILLSLSMPITLLEGSDHSKD